ncbi:MAG: S66 peptidase family protein [Candidatus Xenobia bacterium]
MTKPRPLPPGGTVAVVAPCSPFQPYNLEAGVAWLERHGYQVRHREDLHANWRYLAGSDERRAEELQQALEDATVDAVICARGGYGAGRLIPYLDPGRLTWPRLFAGFSDVTALHLFLQQRCGWVTLHGPMVGTTWAGEGFDEPTEQSFLAALTSPGALPPLKGTCSVQGGRARGRVTGGNLALMAASVGTPWQADCAGAIVLLEDTHEAPYRLDRMLTQLIQSGVLRDAAGVVLGDFDDCDPPEDADFTLLEVLEEVLRPLGIPVAAGFTVGHRATNLTVPLGVAAELDADAATLTFLEAATGPG